MPHIKEHMDACVEKFGEPYKEVNEWMDEFAKYGIWNHRGYRHHKEGIMEAGRLFGKGAMQAAMLHVIMDCGHIPVYSDYESGRVDNFGISKSSDQH